MNSKIAESKYETLADIEVELESCVELEQIFLK
jgi:hypothetical protein